MIRRSSESAPEENRITSPAQLFNLIVKFEAEPPTKEERATSLENEARYSRWEKLLQEAFKGPGIGLLPSWQALVNMRGVRMDPLNYPREGIDLAKPGNPSVETLKTLEKCQQLASSFLKTKGPVARREDIAIRKINRHLSPGDIEVLMFCEYCLLTLAKIQEKRLEGKRSIIGRIPEREMIERVGRVLTKAGNLRGERERADLAEGFLPLYIAANQIASTGRFSRLDYLRAQALIYLFSVIPQAITS